VVPAGGGAPGAGVVGAAGAGVVGAAGGGVVGAAGGGVVADVPDVPDVGVVPVFEPTLYVPGAATSSCSFCAR